MAYPHITQTDYSSESLLIGDYPPLPTVTFLPIGIISESGWWCTELTPTAHSYAWWLTCPIHVTRLDMSALGYSN